MDYNKLSTSLRRKISVYNLVTNLYKDVSIAWEIVMRDEILISGIDAQAIHKLAEDLVISRLVYFYKQSAELSDRILKQLGRETIFVEVGDVESLTNSEKINRVDELILDILPDVFEGVRYDV